MYCNNDNCKIKAYKHINIQYSEYINRQYIGIQPDLFKTLSSPLPKYQSDKQF